MNVLIQFILRFRDSLTLLLYIILSFLFMTSSDNQIVEGLRSTTVYLFGFVQSRFDSLDEYFSLREVNKYLQLENTRLSYENSKLQNALLENIRLRKLLQFKYETGYEFIPAKVVGYSPQDFVTGYLLSTEDYKRVRKNAAVMTADGLVGKVVKKGGKYLICQNLLDPGSRVSVRVQRNRELGIVSWGGGNTLRLNNIPNSVEILKGDVLFTSGMSQIFPPNVKVGVVLSVKLNTTRLFQEITVHPAVNFNILEEVFILQAREQNEPGN